MLTFPGTDGDDLIEMPLRNSTGLPEDMDARQYVVQAGAGADTITAIVENTVVYGGEGDDRLVTDGFWVSEDAFDAPLLYGGQGNDQIVMTMLRGGHLDDQASLGFGGSGNDTLTVRDFDGYFGAGKAGIFGGGGDDRLEALLDGEISITMAGGEGADTFVVDSTYNGFGWTGEAQVVIRDLDVYKDDLIVEGLSMINPDPLFFDPAKPLFLPAFATTVTDTAEGVVLKMDEGGSYEILVRGYSADELAHAHLWDGTVEGTAGDDMIIGKHWQDGNFESAGKGASVVDAGNGNDWVRVRADTLEVQGGDGADTLVGAGDGQQLHGGTGNDLLVGRRFDSELFGGDGDDELKAGLIDGNTHTLTGGQGSDLFRVTQLKGEVAGAVTITDFDAATDRLEIGKSQIDVTAADEDLPDWLTRTMGDDGEMIFGFGDAGHKLVLWLDDGFGMPIYEVPEDGAPQDQDEEDEAEYV